ncbi:NAD(P)H-dependent oxidoreductase [Rhodococcus triatomae]|uniref:NAD(P)H dehydrogenase (Quinone) n=1 Tax=Rhodococcus triatomae TaxID=300028 RepID=A0A1G8B4E4_9NOCA|nr:NAD(P)H-dependent oxidoreductase [Rhodococcus triatomae]QNG17586.1 NAD(P)H-dependent oxidoreductase [Rhodococcus triatomae]QNG22746.1 NAD(P)H-dependent oxidoreductase [Rhodococcus triatomae]SDH28004.1 NAD(P)H dehydrogenase (quinone) [Rhodococcus triatomae]
MTKALWVLAHPDRCSLSAHLRDVGVDTLRSEGWEVEESDLYAMEWDPILVREGGDDVRAEQEKLCAADLVVLQFPLWWYGVPAIMKGWIDRVFEQGFAYDVLNPATGRSRKYGDGGLVGRRALAVVTAGDRPGSLGHRGISGHIDDVLWPLLHGTFWYTGMSALRPHLVANTRAVDDESIGVVDDELRRRIRGLKAEDPIDYLPMTEEHYDHAIRLHPHRSESFEGNLAHRRRPERPA